MTQANCRLFTSWVNKVAAGLCLIISSCILKADEIESRTISLNALTSPLFVSLGADCLTASMMQLFGKRQAAFPLDWLVTMDDEGLIHLLNNNFQDFTNRAHLIAHPINSDKLVHYHYHIEFVHDWTSDYWQKTRYQEEFEKFQIKYQRRIERFQQLANYKGKVIFIRLLRPVHLPPELFWFDFSPNEDEKDYSFSLYAALRRLFPHLDFKLIVVIKTDTSNKMEIFDNITLHYFPRVEEQSNWEQLFHHCSY